MEKHIVQIKTLPLDQENLANAHIAIDTANFWKEKIDVVVEWETISQELRNDIPKLSEYIFNTRLPIAILGCPKITENEIYSRVCKLFFETL